MKKHISRFTLALVPALAVALATLSLQPVAAGPVPVQQVRQAPTLPPGSSVLDEPFGIHTSWKSWKSWKDWKSHRSWKSWK
jgi:hypothetical protein